MYGGISSRVVAGMVAAAAVVFTVAAPATAAPEKCRAAIIKAGAAFAQAKAKALAKCEEAIVKGKRPPGDCHADPKVGPAIAKADAKLRSTITKACAGKDKTCGSSDDAALGDVGWNIGTCPNFANGACDGSITSCADIATCVACIVEAATDEAIAISYDTFVASDPKAQKELNKCQVAIGKATAAFFVAKSKALAKCWTKVNANKATNPCPVPGDGKAAAAIAKAETKRRATICKACGGADKLCNGVGDLTPAAIGFLSQCPDVAAPGGASCAGAVTVLADLVDCIECVNEHAVDCADRSTVPAFVSPYPAECNPVIAPTPTVTETPTPTDDATPTASPTPSETATPEPTPTETATPEPTPSETATPEPTPTETATPEPTPTESATPEPTPTETATPEPTPTESATPEPTPTESATPTPMPTATGELMDAIVSIPTLGDYWGIDVDSTAQNPPSSLPRQRVSNGDALEIVELKVCLGRALGTETGTIHFEIWSDKTTGCEVGAPGCPDEKLGDDSDSFSVDDLATMSGTPSGACGDPGNGQEVTITWSGDTPKPMGSFWIVGVNDSPGGIEDGQVRWGASAVGIVDVHADTDYDSWKVSDTVDNNNDFYFVVRTP